MKTLSLKDGSKMKFRSGVFKVTKPIRHICEYPNPIRRLSFYSEILRFFTEIKEHGIPPEFGKNHAVVIDLAKASSKDRSLLRMRHPSLALYFHLRNLINYLGIQKMVEIRLARRPLQQIHLLFNKNAKPFRARRKS